MHPELKINDLFIVVFAFLKVPFEKYEYTLSYHSIPCNTHTMYSCGIVYNV